MFVYPYLFGRDYLWTIQSLHKLQIFLSPIVLNMKLKKITHLPISNDLNEKEK